jgi:hypothetical protein
MQLVSERNLNSRDTTMMVRLRPNLSSISMQNYKVGRLGCEKHEDFISAFAGRSRHTVIEAASKSALVEYIAKCVTGVQSCA